MYVLDATLSVDGTLKLIPKTEEFITVQLLDNTRVGGGRYSVIVTDCVKYVISLL